MYPVEVRKCYAMQAQREVLLDLISNPVVEESFFLTGGTTLSVFYLHHRLSDDLDFFALNSVDMAEIDFWVRRMWPQESAKIKEGPNFLSFLIKETKVDFVVDPLSSKEGREGLLFENGHRLFVDTIDNISSNKFCTVVSRVEPKDFIDLYFIQKIVPEFDIEHVYADAREKEVLFDDPPTAAYQLEEGLAFLMENQEIFPKVLRDFNIADLIEFYRGVINWLYHKVKV